MLMFTLSAATAVELEGLVHHVEEPLGNESGATSRELLSSRTTNSSPPILPIVSALAQGARQPVRDRDQEPVTGSVTEVSLTFLKSSRSRKSRAPRAS